MTQTKPELQEQIQFAILQQIHHGITGTSELYKKVLAQAEHFTSKMFYPALSGLHRTNLLCWHWKYAENTPSEKHFFLTAKGEKAIAK